MKALRPTLVIYAAFCLIVISIVTIFFLFVNKNFINNVDAFIISIIAAVLGTIVALFQWLFPISTPPEEKQINIKDSAALDDIKITEDDLLAQKNIMLEVEEKKLLIEAKRLELLEEELELQKRRIDYAIESAYKMVDFLIPESTNEDKQVMVRSLIPNIIQLQGLPIELSPEQPNTAASLNNLAELYKNQGKYDLAEPLYQRALAIQEKLVGPEHPNTAASLNNLAELYKNQGKYDLAEPLYQRALAIQEKLVSLDRPHNQNIRNNYEEIPSEAKQHDPKLNNDIE